MRLKCLLAAAILALTGIGCTPEQVALWEQLVAERSADYEWMLRDKFEPLGAGDWVVRVAWCESDMDPNAVNPSSGASGLLQIHPFWNKPNHSDPVAQYIGANWHRRFEPAINIEMGYRIYTAYGPSHWECK